MERGADDRGFEAVGPRDRRRPRESGLVGGRGREPQGRQPDVPAAVLAYNTKSLWTITLQSETTANWEAESDKWTVPVNLLFSKLSSFGPFPASYSFGGGVFPAHSQVGPTWKLRGAITILLPRKK